ncbi:MAG: hypothetical protein ACPK7O_06625 [Methanobacterium sp.]
MSKMLDVVMAGVISGIVAFTTSKMGISGTVIGAALGAMLYQLMSHYIKEPLDNVKRTKIETSVKTRLIYAIPLIFIVGIEIIYVFSAVYWKPEQIFYFLENSTDWNLFRSIGLGLIIMGIYPVLISENIQRSYGYMVLFVGIVTLLKGLVDANLSIVNLYAPIFSEFGFIISLGIIAILLYVIMSVVQESIIINREEIEESN